MKKYLIVIALCLTLGLAPFTPEPHIFGKIRWILGGAHGMGFMDWWDTIQHGAPWAVLIYLIVQDGLKRFRKTNR